MAIRGARWGLLGFPRAGRRVAVRAAGAPGGGGACRIRRRRRRRRGRHLRRSFDVRVRRTEGFDFFIIRCTFPDGVDEPAEGAAEVRGEPALGAVRLEPSHAVVAARAVRRELAAAVPGESVITIMPDLYAESGFTRLVLGWLAGW